MQMKQQLGLARTSHTRIEKRQPWGTTGGLQEPAAITVPREEIGRCEEQLYWNQLAELGASIMLNQANGSGQTTYLAQRLAR